LVQAAEGDTEEASRILSGLLALEVEGVNMSQVLVTTLILHNAPPNIPRAHRPATTPRLPTTITPSALRRTYKSRTLVARSDPRPTIKCLRLIGHPRPGRSPQRPNSASPSRHPNPPQLLPRNPRYRPSSMPLPLANRRRNRTMTETGTDEICRAMSLRSLHLQDLVVAIIGSNCNHNALSLHHREYVWSRRP